MSIDQDKPGRGHAGTSTDLSASPEAIVDAVLERDRRVLLVGQPGVGKSTLVHALARALTGAGRRCWCLGADPGSPLFGVPGAVCLARRQDEDWHTVAIEALCTLDAGRFRLPLVAAAARLAQGQALHEERGVVLIDGPGVVRGVAGAELLLGLAEATGAEAVLALRPGTRPAPLAPELAALGVPIYVLTASGEARRPGKRSRARDRTDLWEQYLVGAEVQSLAFRSITPVGLPPPTDRPDAWTGRQVAVLDGTRTRTLGEVVQADAAALHVRLPQKVEGPVTLLVRDAARLADGRVGTAEPFAPEPLTYLPPLDVAAEAPGGGAGRPLGPRVAGRVGSLSVSLINGVFGDPLLHLRLRHQRRSLLFDLGEGARLPARIAHQVTDVFISHAHMDHIAGFLWLLRSRIGELPPCRVYGPPGLANHVAGLIRGVLWDRVAEHAPVFEIAELHGNRRWRYAIHAGQHEARFIDQRAAPEGVLLAEPGFCVRATTLDHGTPVLAFAFEPAAQLNVRKDRLIARGLTPGAWLGELKRLIRAGGQAGSLRLPDGSRASVSALADELVLVNPGKKLVYATDLADTADNRRRLITLAHDAHTLFCEAAFLEADAAQAARTSHLTARACGEIAEDAGVARLVPFHFSRRYEHDPWAVYSEVAASCTRVSIPPRARRAGGPGKRRGETPTVPVRES